LPLERHIDDLTACDGIKFWMSDGERPVLCRVSHEALRDFADRVRFPGTDEKVFEAYRELIEQGRAAWSDLASVRSSLGRLKKCSEASCWVPCPGVAMALSGRPPSLYNILSWPLSGR
jgi:hypothetical protein